eukprot:COSAG02_NODE_1358_length_13076_cov_6.377745_6_plen_50_part_00
MAVYPLVRQRSGDIRMNNAEDAERHITNQNNVCVRIPTFWVRLQKCIRL